MEMPLEKEREIIRGPSAKIWIDYMGVNRIKILTRETYMWLYEAIRLKVLIHTCAYRLSNEVLAGGMK